MLSNSTGIYNKHGRCFRNVEGENISSSALHQDLLDFLLDGLIFGHLLQIVWSGLVVHILYKAITFVCFGARGVIETLVINMSYLLRRTHNFTKFLILLRANVELPKVCDCDVKRVA